MPVVCRGLVSNQKSRARLKRTNDRSFGVGGEREGADSKRLLRVARSGSNNTLDKGDSERREVIRTPGGVLKAAGG
jgi:hypothetical protein